MKKKISMALAILFALSLSIPAAGAVDLDRVMLSENAGSTVKCQLVQFDDYGQTGSRIIDVAIPSDATKAQEDAIIQNAIQQEAISTTSAARNIMDEICVREDVSLNSILYANVGSGIIPGPDYIMLLVVFSNYLNVGANNLSVVVTGGRYPSNSYTMTASIADSSLTNIIAYMYTGSGNVFLTNGSSVSVKARTDSGALNADTCTIYVSQQNVAGG